MQENFYVELFVQNIMKNNDEYTGVKRNENLGKNEFA